MNKSEQPKQGRQLIKQSKGPNEMQVAQVYCICIIISTIYLFSIHKPSAPHIFFFLSPGVLFP